MMIPKPKRNKFNAKKVRDINGKVLYDSMLERDYHAELKLREAAGDIRDLVYHPQLYLTEANVGYKPDFHYIDSKTGKPIFVDTKGVETSGRFAVIKKLWKVYGQGELHIVKRSDGRFFTAQVVKVIGGLNKEDYICSLT